MYLLSSAQYMSFRNTRLHLQHHSVHFESENLHQSGQLLCSVWVPEVDPPAGATEGRSGEQRPVRGEVTGRQEVQGLPGPSCQVPHEGV